jgi:hypothetical protein
MAHAIARRVSSPSIEILENRRHLSASPPTVAAPVIQQTVTIGIGGTSGVLFTGDNGLYDGITVRHATATIVFSGIGVSVNMTGHTYFRKSLVETIESIAITNALPNKASLQVTTSFGPGLVNLGSITGGNLSSIIAPTANLVGDINVTSVNNVILGNVAGPMLNLGSSVHNVRVYGVLTGSLTAGTIGTIKAGAITNTSIGTTAPFSAKQLDIGLIDGGTGIEESEINSVGNIGTVRAKFIDKSVITAGATLAATTPETFPASVLPEVSGNFYAAATIHNVQVVKTKGAGYFDDSVVAAQTIVSANLGQAGTDGGGGIAAHKFGSLVITAPVGSLDLAKLVLNAPSLSSSVHLAAVLANRNVTHTSGVLGADNVQFFGLSLNVLR